MGMSTRLKQARIAAGYKSATEAIEKLKWNSSTYRAHENGQNNYKISDAEKYAKAYSVNAAWLLLGENKQTSKAKNKQKMTGCSKQTCPEKIYALSILIKDDAENYGLINKLYECVDNYRDILADA